MEIYLLMTGIVVLLGIPLIEIKPTRTKKLCYIIIVYIVMLTVSVFRYGLGNDYYSYYYILQKVADADWLQIFGLGYEPGFVLLDKIISCFTMDVQVMFAIYAVLILTATCYAIFMHSENLWMSVMMFISLTFFYNSLSFIRQAMAVALILLGWRYFKERNHFMVMLFIFFGALFHSTVIIMIPLYFLAILIKPTGITVPIYAAVITFIFSFSWQILDLGVMIFPQYKSYLDLNFIQNGFKPVYIILPSVIMGLALLAHFTGYGKAYPKSSSLFTSMAIFNFVFWLISLKHFILERFSMYPYILIIMFIPSVVNYYKQCMLVHFAKQRGLIYTPDTTVYESLHSAENKADASAEIPSLQSFEDEEAESTADNSERQGEVEATGVTQADDKQSPDIREFPSDYKPSMELEYSREYETGKYYRPIENFDYFPIMNASEYNEDEDDEEYDDYDDYDYYDEKPPLRERFIAWFKEHKKMRYVSDALYYPQNYRYKKYRFLPLNIITHPATLFSFFLVVATVGSLWYNYFGVTVSSSGFHGVVPYRSTVPSYMEWFMGKEKQEDKNNLLRSERNFFSYLYRITGNDNYSAVISSNDDNYNGLNGPVRRLLKQLGFVKLSEIENGYYYIAIVESGEVIYENVSETPIQYSTEINGFKTKIRSGKDDSSIVMGAKDFSRNQRGLNIVVMDNTRKSVVDKLRVKAYYVMLAITRD